MDDWDAFFAALTRWLAKMMLIGIASIVLAILMWILVAVAA